MAATLTEKPVNSRPTIRIDGMKKSLVDEMLQSMSLRETADGMAALELGFTDWVSRPGGSPEFAFGDGAFLKLGAEIKIYGGDVNDPQEIFRGRISALESDCAVDSPPMIIALAEDRLNAARKTRRCETFEAATLEDIVRKVANRHGLSAVVKDLPSVKSDWVQLNESDLAFLRRLTSRFEASIQVVGDELQVKVFGAEPRGKLELRLNDKLLSICITADLAEQAKEVSVSGYDTAKGSATRQSAATGSLGPGKGSTGASLVESALNAGRSENLGQFGDIAVDEAKAMSSAAFARRARRFVQARGLAEGNAELRVGTWLTLKRVNPMFEGDYVVSETHHAFSLKTGYTTAFTAHSAYFGGTS